MIPFVSNVVIASLNLIGLPFAVLSLIGSIYSIINGRSPCEADGRPEGFWNLIFAIFLLAMIISGFVGSWMNKKRFILAYLSMLVVLTLVTLGFTIFFIFLTSQAPKPLGNRFHSMNYSLSDFPSSLRKYLVNDKDWAFSKRCMVKLKLCSLSPSNKKRVHHIDYNMKVGCCQPPANCGFTQKTGTWVAPKSGNVSKGHDCTVWSNHRDKLCFDCDTCKISSLTKYVILRRGEIGFNFFLIVVFLVVSSVGYCAFKNSQRLGHH